MNLIFLSLWFHCFEWAHVSGCLALHRTLWTYVHNVLCSFCSLNFSVSQSVRGRDRILNHLGVARKRCAHAHRWDWVCWWHRDTAYVRNIVDWLIVSITGQIETYRYLWRHAYVLYLTRCIFTFGIYSAHLDIIELVAIFYKLWSSNSKSQSSSSSSWKH